MDRAGRRAPRHDEVVDAGVEALRVADVDLRRVRQVVRLAVVALALGGLAGLERREHLRRRVWAAAGESAARALAGTKMSVSWGSQMYDPGARVAILARRRRWLPDHAERGLGVPRATKSRRTSWLPQDA